MYRHLIEDMGKEEFLLDGTADKGPVYWITTITKADSNGRGGREVAGLDRAKAECQERERGHTDDNGDPIVLRWKPGPKDWDGVVAVSQWIEEMYPDLPVD